MVWEWEALEPGAGHLVRSGLGLEVVVGSALGSGWVVDFPGQWERQEGE